MAQKGARSEETIVTITLSEEAGGERAILRVSDGIDIRTVTSIAGAVQQFGSAKVVLSIVPDGVDLSPSILTGDRHAGIRILSDRAEIYVTNDMPIEFVQLLSDQVKQIEGVEAIALKSVSFKPSQRSSPGADPFGGSGPAASPTADRAPASGNPFGG